MSIARGYLIAAGALVLLFSGLHAALRLDPKVRNRRIFTEMMDSRAVESFEQSRWLPGGLAQQPLVEGVVPRGELPLRYGTGPEEAQRAGRELHSPFAADDAAARTRGKELFGIYCTVCHDAGGNGRGPAVLRGMLPPPSLHAARAKTMADGEMFHILTFGQGNMASYAAQLTRTERWQVISYVRQLQEQAR